MFKLILISGVLIALAVTGLVSPWTPILLGDPEAEAILDEIAENLEAVAAVTADLDCVSNSDAATFVDGFLAMEGQFNTYLDRGSAGEVWWRNEVAFNLTSAEVGTGDTAGLRWDDSIEDSLSAWGDFNGLEDPRVAIGIAWSVPEGLTKKAGTYNIQGITCVLLESEAVRLYVDDAHHHRLIRIEVEFENSESIGYRTDFLEWTEVAGGEFPAQISCRAYRDLNEQDLVTFDYVLSNIQGQAEIDPELFELNYIPEDTGGSPPPNTPEAK